MQHDRHESALAVLRKIHHDSKDPESNFAKAEFNAIREQCLLENKAGYGTYRELLGNRHNLKRAVLGFLNMFGAQCTGTLVINSTFHLDNDLHGTQRAESDSKRL